MQGVLQPTPRQQFWIVLSVGLAGFMVTLDSSIVNISLPAISDHFQASTSEVSWVVLSYLLMIASTLLICGKVADRVGLKPVFLVGYILFTLGSLFCGLSPTLLLLVLARVLQGLGGAMIYTVSFAIVPRFLPPQRTARAFGLIMSVATLGIIMGAPLGGFITGSFSWHWIFLINVPVGCAVILVVLLEIPRDRPLARAAGFDLLGAALSLLGFALLVYSVNMGQENGWLAAGTLVPGGVSLLLLAAFYCRQRLAAAPLLDLDLFLDRAFLCGSLAAFLACGFLSGWNFLIPFYLEKVQGLTTTSSGLVVMLSAIMAMLSGPVAGRFVARLTARGVCMLALVPSLAGFAFFAATLGRPGITSAALLLMLLGISYGAFIAVNNDLVMSLPPADQKGEASGAFKSIGNLGMIFGVTAFETVFTLRFPPGSSPTGGHHPDAIPLPDLLTGFRDAAFLGILVALAAILLSWLADPRASPRGQSA